MPLLVHCVPELVEQAPEREDADQAQGGPREDVFAYSIITLTCLVAQDEHGYRSQVKVKQDALLSIPVNCQCSKQRMPLYQFGRLTESGVRFQFDCWILVLNYMSIHMRITVRSYLCYTYMIYQGGPYYYYDYD